MNRVSITDLVDRLSPPLSDEELAEFARLANALAHAIDVASNLPTTLDPRSRALIVTKLQEAEHWSIELLRVAARPRISP